MNITYTVDLCHLYDNRFCTGYTKMLDENDNVLSDEFWGYFDCSLRDEDLKRKHQETRNKIGKYLDEVINNNKVDLNEIKKFMDKLDVKYVKLNDIKYKCEDGIEYRLLRTINTETNKIEGLEVDV